MPDEAVVLASLVAWGQSSPSVRALVLTSSRARQDGSADLLSDYDVIVAVRDAASFVADEAWLAGYREPLVGWGDKDELLGSTTTFRGVVHADGVRIDYTLWPEVLLGRVSEEATLPDALDVGYRVLLDKDGQTSHWPPPTYTAHVPARPTKEEYDALVEEFWWDTTYVAKALWRGELFFAKFMLDFDTKHIALRRFLEWQVELDHDWALRPGAYGRGLERLLPSDVWAELARTYVGTDVEENWEALSRTIALFRRVATDVADALGFEYPQATEEAMTAQLRAVRALPPRSG
jgi:aminoglycoside 6-adenylyltransferase